MRSNLRFGAAPIIMSLLLASCGGGDGSAPPVSATPTPSPTPTPTVGVTGSTDKIVYAASTTAYFADEGRYWTDGGMRVNFNASTGFYYATDPASTTPGIVNRAPNYSPPAGQPWQLFVTANGTQFTALLSGQSNYAEPYRFLYSNVLGWAVGTNGYTAIGIPTAVGSGPKSGQADYLGPLYVVTDELVPYEGGMVRDEFGGSVQVRFDATAQTARLTILPTAGPGPIQVASLNPVNLTWSGGGATFFQPDPTSATSQNYPISGVFTGPGAEELIGGIRFNYVSPRDGKTYEARGAFAAKR